MNMIFPYLWNCFGNNLKSAKLVFKSISMNVCCLSNILKFEILISCCGDLTQNFFSKMSELLLPTCLHLHLALACLHVSSAIKSDVNRFFSW